MSAPFDHSRVIHETCPECGHDVAGVPTEHLAPALSESARRWHELLVTVSDHPGGLDRLATRPQPDVWAAIEYACHARDVVALAGRRVELVLLSDDPLFEEWDHRAIAEQHHYREQLPEAVADDLVAGAAELGALIRRLTPGQRLRSGFGSGVRCSAEGLVRLALHEMRHHLDDARRVLPPPDR